MENQNISEVVEIVEVTEEVMPVSSGNGWKVACGAAVLTGIGFGVYKLIKKLKAKKEQKVESEEICDEINEECVEDND